MPVRTKLKIGQWKTLFDLILLKYTDNKYDYSLFIASLKKITITEFFGFENYDPLNSSGELSEFQSSLKAKMLCDIDIVRLLTKNQSLTRISIQSKIEASKQFIGSSIYKYFHNFEKLQDDVLKGIQYPYSDILLKYAGFKNKSDFLNIIELGGSKDNPSEFIEFFGYYFDYGTYEVQSFQMDFDFGKISDLSDYSLINCRESGLHFSDHGYEGNAYISNQKLHIVLVNKSLSKINQERIKIIINSTDAPKEQVEMRGLFLASTSLNSSPIAGEIVLLKKDIFDLEQKVLQIKKYLQLKHQNIIVNNKKINFESIEVKGLNINVFENFVGVWRILSLDESKNLVTSILHVDSSYKAIFYSQKSKVTGKFNIAENCTIESFYKNPKVINLTTFDYKRNITSQILIHNPSQDEKETEGVALNIDPKNMKSLPLSRFLSLFKSEDDQLTQIFKDSKEQVLPYKIKSYLLKFNLKEEFYFYLNNSESIVQRDELICLQKNLEHIYSEKEIDFNDWNYVSYYYQF